MDESLKKEYDLRGLSVEELSALLCEAPPEDGFIEALIEEYARRTQDAEAAEAGKEACLAALGRAVTPRKKRRVLRFALAAAAAVLALAGAVFALGEGRWPVHSDDFLFLFTGKEDRAQTLRVPAEEGDLAAFLASAGLPEYLVPSYLPDGYEPRPIEAVVEPETGYADVRQSFVKDGERIEYRYFTIDSPLGLVRARDAGDPEVYYAGGEAHYIMTLDGRYFAVWQRGSFECSLSGYPDRDELVRAIDSMYD